MQLADVRFGPSSRSSHHWAGISAKDEKDIENCQGGRERQMGCVSSRPEFPNDVHPNIFTVTTIAKPNSIGDTRSSTRDNATGHLEVTNNELILHRRGHDAVHWPLQYIRRYGFENHLFSFESGRRCESGPGIFTFRCRQARELFTLVQRNIQDARTPPTGGSEPTSGLPSRVRSGSVTSQSQIAFSPAFDSSNSRRSLNDYLSPEPAGTLRTTTSLTTNGNPNSTVPSPRTESCGGGTESGPFDDIDSGQVFVEITPSRNNIGGPSRQRLVNEERRQRLSSARSQTSSAASDHSLSTVFGQQGKARPISFEFVLSSTSTPPDGENAFASPQPSNTSPSASPPLFSYYVNVAPPLSNIDGTPKKIDYSQRHLSADKHSNGTCKPPARSQSLGSPNAADRNQYFGSSSGDGAYVNIVRGGSTSTSPAVARQENQKGYATGNDSINVTLDYVTLDVGGGASPSPSPSSLHHRPHRRLSSHTAGANESLLVGGKRSSTSALFASSLTSVAEVGSSKSGEGLNDQISTSNYARIDCTRTKALRETAAAAQMQRHSTSCSASSSEATIAGDQVTSVIRRTRHDSSIISNADRSSGHKAL